LAVHWCSELAADCQLGIRHDAATRCGYSGCGGDTVLVLRGRQTQCSGRNGAASPARANEQRAGASSVLASKNRLHGAALA
jgi:hypothetical protein